MSANATGADRAALTDEGITTVTDVADRDRDTGALRRARRLRRRGRSSSRRRSRSTSTAKTDSRAARVQRTHRAHVRARPDGTWSITAYRVGVDAPKPRPTTTTATTAEAHVVIRAHRHRASSSPTSCVARRWQSSGSARRGSPASRCRSRPARRTCRSQKLAARRRRRLADRHVLHRADRQRPAARCRRRPRRRAAPRRREPGDQHRDDAQRPARHLLAGRQDQPRARATAARAAWPNALGELDRRAGRLRVVGRLRRLHRASSTASAACRSTCRCAMDDNVLGRGLRAGRATHMNGDQALAFSRDRHDFPNSDITRTEQPGPADPRRDARSCRPRRRARLGEFKTARAARPPRAARRPRPQRRLPARPRRRSSSTPPRSAT